MGETGGRSASVRATAGRTTTLARRAAEWNRDGDGVGFAYNLLSPGFKRSKRLMRNAKAHHLDPCIPLRVAGMLEPVGRAGWAQRRTTTPTAGQSLASRHRGWKPSARQLARCRMRQTRGSQDGSPSCRLPRAVPDTADRTGCRFLNDAWPSKSRILLKEETRYCKHSSRTLDTIQLPYVYPQAWMVIDCHAEIRGASCACQR